MIFKILPTKTKGQVLCYGQLLQKGTNKVENSVLTLPRGKCLLCSALIPELETALFEEMRFRDFSVQIINHRSNSV